MATRTSTSPNTAVHPSAATAGKRPAYAVERLTRILLVEDEALTAEVFAKALRSDGHQVEIARDGLQALHRLQRRTPTLLVLDMNLPTVCGADVLRRLRAGGHDQLPIIVVSGSPASATNLDDALLRPGVWLEKPVRPRELIRIVRQFVHGAEE